MKTSQFVVPRGLSRLPLASFFDGPWLRRLLLSTSLAEGGVAFARVSYVKIKAHDRVVLGIEADDEAGQRSFLSATLDDLDRLKEEQRRDLGASASVLCTSAPALLRVFEQDRKLSGLRYALDMNWLRRKLQAESGLVEDRWRIRRRKSDLQWVRYKPERRAVARVTLSLSDDRTQERSQRDLFLRCQNDGNAAVSQWVMRSALEAGLRVPMPLTILGHGIRIESELEGTPLETADALVGVLRRAGAWLARLHAVAPCPVQRRSMDFLRRRHASIPQELALLDPAAALWAEELAQRLTAQAPRVEDARQLHGDFHPGQLLQQPDGLGVVDFDRVCLGDPSFDLAVFYAHLVEDLPDLAELMYRALLKGYSDVSLLPPASVRNWYECAALLTEAAAGFRRARSDWALRMHRKLQLVETRLQTVGSES